MDDLTSVVDGLVAIKDAIGTVVLSAGTVTDVSVVTANGVSGSVATSTTTPAITLSLGAIAPSTVAIGAGAAITSSGAGGALGTAAFTAATAYQAAGAVSDTAYDATSWDGVTTIAPSKNAVRDKIESLPAPSSVISDVAYDATTWDGVTTIAPSKNAVRDKIQTLAASGANSDITSLTGITTAIFNYSNAPVGQTFVFSKTGIDVTQADSTVIDLFTVPVGKSCIVMNGFIVTTAVTGATSVGGTYQIIESGASLLMCETSLAPAGTNAVGKIIGTIYDNNSGGPNINVCATGNKVQLKIIAHNTSTTCTARFDGTFIYF